MLTRNIYCYYEEIGNGQEPPLIEYWKERWEKEGWSATVLGVADARKDSRFKAMCEKHERGPYLPGHREYGKANFCRWLAFAHIDGAICDYDVIPVAPFPPREFEGFVCGSMNGAPGFLVGNASDYSKVADEILCYRAQPEDQVAGLPHVSDMMILVRGARRYTKILDLIGSWQTPPVGQGRPLVHFDNTYLVPYDKVSRVDKIRAIVQSVYP